MLLSEVDRRCAHPVHLMVDNKLLEAALLDEDDGGNDVVCGSDLPVTARCCFPTTRCRALCSSLCMHCNQLLWRQGSCCHGSQAGHVLLAEYLDASLLCMSCRRQQVTVLYVL